MFDKILSPRDHPLNTNRKVRDPNDLSLASTLQHTKHNKIILPVLQRCHTRFLTLANIRCGQAVNIDTERLIQNR
jgi:hypothetical protein